MGQSVKAVVQLLLILIGISTLLIWEVPEHLDITIWCFRFAMPAIGIALVILLVKNARRKEKLPDQLLWQVGSYFERDGFCFGFAPIAISGISWMQIYFHNRYERQCTARVVLQPPREYFLGKQAHLAGIDVDINCGGGEFGVCRVPWPIPKRLQGKKTHFEIAAMASYPVGPGKQLRYREGLRVGTPGGGAARTAATAGLMLVGVIHISRPATLRMALPTAVGEISPPGAGVVTEMLYSPPP